MNNQPIVNIGMVANVYIRSMIFAEAGDCEQCHKHAFDHITLLAKGSVKVISEGVETIFNAPHMIFIPKDKNHELIALEKDTLAYCIHGIREKDTGDIVDASMMVQYKDTII